VAFKPLWLAELLSLTHMLLAGHPRRPSGTSEDPITRLA
jgi:hypothetical protein